jgi:hypothetical protein
LPSGTFPKYAKNALSFGKHAIILYAWRQMIAMIQYDLKYTEWVLISYTIYKDEQF